MPKLTGNILIDRQNNNQSAWVPLGQSIPEKDTTVIEKPTPVIKWNVIANDPRYKTATPEKQIELQDKYFNNFVKASPLYKPEYESKIKSKLFGAPAMRDRGIITAMAYSFAEGATNLWKQMAVGTEKLFPQQDLITWRRERLDKRRSSLTPEQIAREESNIKQVEDWQKIEKTEKDRLGKEIAYTKAKHPVVSFVGQAGGGLAPYTLFGATGLPTWVTFGGLGILDEASRQFANPEEKLSPIQRAAKVSISGAAGMTVGMIFKNAGSEFRIGDKVIMPMAKSFTSRAIRRSGGAGAVTMAESLIDDFASNTKPDVNKALLRGGLNAATIGVFSFLTELPELKGMVWQEAKAAVGKQKLSEGAKIGERYTEPKTYEEAKQIVREVTQTSPEELSPQFKKAKQEIIKRGIRKDVKENIEYYKKKVGLNENEINELLNVKSINQFDELARNYSAINPEFVKRILPFREQIAQGLATPEEIIMAMELREMAKPQTAQSEVVKTEKPVIAEKTQGQILKEQAISDVRIQAAQRGIEVTPVTPTTQQVPIQLPKELTEGEHLFTAEQALDKTVQEISESEYTQNDIFQTNVQTPIENQVKALKDQLAGLKGQRGGETALARKDIIDKIDGLKSQLSQANDVVQEQYMNWGMQLQDIIKTKTKEQGLNLDEEKMQNLADQVTMTITEPWGKERYWNTKVSDVIDDVIQSYKTPQEVIPEVKVKKPTEEFKIGDIFDPQGKTNMVGQVTIREISGNTLKFTDSEGTEFSGMQRSLVRDLVKEGSWKKEIQPTGEGKVESDKLLDNGKIKYLDPDLYSNRTDFVRDVEQLNPIPMDKEWGDKARTQIDEAFKVWGDREPSKRTVEIPVDKVDLVEHPLSYEMDTSKDITEPIDVIYSNGRYRLVDGRHRLAQAKFNKQKTIIAKVEGQSPLTDPKNIELTREWKASLEKDGFISTPTGEGKVTQSDIKLAGYYDTTGSTEKDEHENGNLMPGKKLKKDIVKFGNALKAELGWEWGMSGKKFTSPDVNNNHASMAIMKPGSDWGIYISIDAKEVNGDDLELGGSLGTGMAFLYRATKRSDPWGGQSNNYAAGDITVGELAKKIIKTVEFHSVPVEEAVKDYSEHAKEKIEAFKKEKAESKKPLTEVKENVILKSEIKETENVQIPGVTQRVIGSEPGNEQTLEQEQQRRSESIKSAVKQQRSEQHNQESDQESRVANLGNYRITADDLIGQGSPKEKYKSNILAIKLLKKIESENRKATPEEQAVLVRYVGWGGLSKVFDRYDTKGWDKEYTELKELLTEEEYDAARASTINAHYTSPEVISAMWQAVLNMGFERGKVLEPAMGIGHFIGLRPESAKIAFTGVELDSLTGRIAKQLYQNGDVQIRGFEETQLSKDFYDLAISNVPFADIKPYDPRISYLGIPAGLNLHDYFFAKSLALIKPGGVVAFITSKGTMDKQDSKLRKWITERADLLGAIRLPNTAFKANAGTEVTTDIIFLRKRLPKETPSGEAWINSTETKISNRNVFVNEYFIKNTAMVLGNMKVGRGQYADNELTVEPFDEPLDQSLSKAIDYLPKNVIKTLVDIIEEHQTKTKEEIKDFSVKLGSYVFESGKIYQKEKDTLVERDFDKDKARMVALIQIKDARQALIDKQTKEEGDQSFQTELKILNATYDKFVKQYGFINSKTNQTLLEDSTVDLPILSSLEVEGKEKDTFLKNNIFSTRVIKKHVRPVVADNAQEAVYISLSEYGNLNWKYMSELTGRLTDDLQKELSDANIIFKNPEGEVWETKDRYLSGNVKLKLKLAQEVSRVDPAYSKNIEELKKIIPRDVEFQKIGIEIGTGFIGLDDYKKFISELLGVSTHRVRASKNPHDNRFDFGLESSYSGSSANTEQWGTGRYSAIALIEAIANYKNIKVLDSFTVDGEKKYVLNEQETALAQDKAELIKNKFQDWFWADEERRDKYVKLYNDVYNVFVEQVHNGTHLKLPGMSPVYEIRKSQFDAIWRGILQRNLVLAHEVGAGKTLIMIAIMMESKRLGLINKPMAVVLNNTLSQWKREFTSLYPNAKIIVADEKNFEKSKRRAFLAKVSSGEYDAVVISHSAFKLIDMSEEAYTEYIQEQIDERRLTLDRLGTDKEHRLTVKKIETMIKTLEERLKKKLDKIEKDEAMSFEELGVDSIFVDESDEFKNLGYTTKLTSRGLGNIDGNQKAEDLMMKIRHVQKLGGKVVFATGTPVSNSLSETHVVMRFTQPDLLKELGIEDFDSWSKLFAKVDFDYEINAAGVWTSINRLRDFKNLRILIKRMREVWDIQTAEMLEKAGILVKGKNLPFYKGGKPANRLLPNSPELVEYMQELRIRAEKVKGKRPEKGGDNILKIFGDGVKASTDMRLIDPTLPGNPNSKIEIGIIDIFELWKDTKADQLTQVIFIDNTKPHKDAAFNPQWYMKRKLMEMGVPENEIAFIHDFDEPASKKTERLQEFYDKVNDGEIRIVFGSTKKLGAGTNIQKRLVAERHIDVPKRPRDMIQREGRIMRPGNTNKEIEIVRYTVEGSLDAMLYQMLEVKLRGISKLFSDPNAEIDEISETVDEYSIIKAATAGNPLIKEKVEVEKAVRQLRNLKNGFLSEKAKAQKNLKEIPVEIASLKKRIDGVKDDIAKRPEKLTKETFKIEIGGKEYTTKEDAWTAINKSFDNIRAEDWDKEIPLGKYQGFDMVIYKGKEFSDGSQHKYIYIKGAVNYEAIFSESAIGTFASIDNALYSWPEKLLENTNMRYEESNKHLIISKAIAEKEFDKQKTLEEKEKRKIEIDREIANIVASGPEERKEDDDTIIEMHSGLMFGQVKQEPINDNLNTGEPTFIDSEVERRFKEAHGQKHPNGLIFRIKQSFANIIEGSKVFPGLPNTEFYAQAKFILGQQAHAMGRAKDNTIRAINNITHGFGKNKLNLFTRAVILADFMQEAEKGRPIPMGYSYYDDEGNVVINTELLRRDKENIDAWVNQNPDVKAALERRTAINKQITDDLVKYKILTREQVKDDYYRHQVLEYANTKATFGTGKKLRTPSPGYARRRFGTVDKDINTNYLEAEFEFMSQAYHDIETAKNIEKFRTGPYNIKNSLKEEARQLNDQMLDRVTIEGQYNKNGDPATLRDLIKPFNSKMAFGFSNLEKLGYDFPVGEGSFEELAKLAENESVDPMAQMNAKMILKAVSDRRNFIKRNLGKNYKEWKDIIPEGYTTWQPKEGRVFFNAFSIPQRIIDEVVNKAGEEVGIDKEDLKKLLAVGGAREEFVIPQELADTLNNMYTVKLPNFIFDAIKEVTTVWKKWVLLNPRRVLSYNFQNFLGDTDHVVAANPRILRFFHRAASELRGMFFLGKSMPLEMREFFERGGLSTMLTIQEIPDINTLEIFQRMTRTAENAFSIEQAKIELHKAWNTVVRYTLFRESILRYAAYLHYREVFLSGRKEYGGSRREDVEGLSNPLDKAAKVATDTLGDYSNISKNMKDMRETVLPFGSWLEVNFKIYYNLHRNALIEGGMGKGLQTFVTTGVGAGIRATTAAGSFYLRFLIWSFLMTGIWALYNQLFHKEEESKLNPYDQNRMHLVIGTNKDGSIKIRRGQGAMSDLLEWVGADQALILYRDYIDGKASLIDLFGKPPFFIGKIGLGPAILKIMRGISPVYKAVVETATGKYLPGLDERSGTVEDKLRNILKAWNMENEYDWITKKPSRGYVKSWEQAFITTTEPQENAFRYIQGQKYAYRERLGKGGSGDYYTPRSVLYRQYKKALLYKDEGARVAAIKEMIKLGVTVEDLDRSLTTNDPLYGLNEEQKVDFVRNYLTVRDREKLRDAYRYYIKVFVREKKK